MCCVGGIRIKEENLFEQLANFDPHIQVENRGNGRDDEFQVFG